MTRIALVVPNRNGGRYFVKLLSDLDRLQEWPDELIIVDGQSTDGGKELADEFAKRNLSRSRISVLSLAPTGIYDAWNSGVATSTANWIHIVCSDDCIEPDAYILIRERLKYSSGRDLETFDCAVVDDEDRRIGMVRRLSHLDSVANGWLDVPHHRLAPLEALLLFCCRSVTVSFVGVLVPADLAKAMPFPSDAGSSGDVDWLLRVALAGYGTNYTPAVVGAWRTHSQGATAAASGVGRVATHRRIRQRHLLALLTLTTGRLKGNQRRRIAHMANGDIGVDFFDIFADAKKANGLARFQLLLRSLRLALGKIMVLPAWSAVRSRHGFVRQMRTVDIRVLIAGTDLLQLREISNKKT